jgi:2-polyprenyl-3-methyl-5-hydroxy-6-metoxy-1,4-benzoquinol methylase
LPKNPSLKDKWIADHVKGKTFADVGGLWGTVNEKVTVALGAGAKKATMIDIAPLDKKLWDDFRVHCREKGVSNYQCIQADATDGSLKDLVGAFDMVHCSGVIYHVPDFIGLIRNLRSIANRHLIITSMIFPERIENKFGVLDMSGGNAMFVPLLTESQRQIAGKYASDMKLNVAHLNGHAVTNWYTPAGHWAFGPWSWLITPQFLSGIASVCELHVVAGCYGWGKRTYSILCDVV